MTALVASLCVVVHAGVVFANRSLCASVSQLLGAPSATARRTYDLRIDHPDVGTQLDERGWLDRVHRYIDSARIRPAA